MKSLASRFLPAILIIAAVLGWKYYNKNQTSEEVRQEAQALVAAFPDYAENKEYYDAAFQQFHVPAFDQAYKMGGRRTSAKFDADEYLAVLMARIRYDASQAGKMTIVRALDGHRQALGLPTVDFQ